MKNMLGVSLREARGPINSLMEKLTGEDGEMWLGLLNKLNRGEPCLVDGIPYPKLKWVRLSEFVNFANTQDVIDDYRTEHGSGWRLPTDDELNRFLHSADPATFQSFNQGHYLTLMVTGGRVMEVFRAHNGEGGLYRDDSRGVQFRLILCCEEGT